MADRRERVILDLDPSPYVRGLGVAEGATDSFIAKLDTTNDRAALITQSILALAPAAVATLASATPAVSGLAASFGLAAGAAGVMVLGTVGVGDALEALNNYQLEQTPENLEKLEDAMRNLGPAARDFVVFLDDIGPKLQSLREEAQGGFLPGAEDGIDALLDRLPQLRDIIGEIASASGDLAEATGRDLAGGDWDDFFDYLQNEARPTLISFGQTFGNIFEGIANTMVALDPASDDFVRGLLAWSEDFADATAGLQESERFQSFLDYVRDNGPQAVDTFGSLADMLLAFGEAAAPVGAATLPILEAVAEVLAVIARSPVGPILIAAAAGISAVSRGVALYNAANGSAMLGLLRDSGQAGQSGATGLTAFGKAAGALTAVAFVLPILDQLVSKVAGVAPTVEEAREALLQLGSGGQIDSSILDDLDDKIGRIADPLVGEKIADFLLPIDTVKVRNATEDIDALDKALAQTVSDGHAEEAAEQLAALQDKISPERYKLLVDELLPEYNDALRAQANAAELAGEGSSEAARGMLRAERAATRLRQRELALAEALEEARAAAEDQARTFVNMADAVGDGQKSLDQFIRSLARQAEDLRNFRLNAEEAAEKGLEEGLIDSLRELGPLGARQMRQLANATRSEIDRANEAWLDGERQVNLYTDAVGGVPSSKTTYLTVIGAKEGISDTRALYNAIADLRSKTVTVTTVFTSSGQRFKEFGPAGSAYGSTVPDDGGPYADRFPYLLAPREEVVANDIGQADYYRDTLKAINSGASEETVAATIPNIYAEPVVDGGRGGAGGGGTSTYERVVETIVVDAGELGEIVVDVADGKVRQYRRHDQGRANAQSYGGYSDV